MSQPASARLAEVLAHDGPASSTVQMPPLGTRRPRRLRRTPGIRALVREHRVHSSDLVLPVFIREGLTESRPVTSLPGVYQHPVGKVREIIDAASQAELGGVMLFGVPSETDKDALGSAAAAAGGVLNRSIEAARAAAGPDLVVMSDLCLDEFTTHGHCGVLDVHGHVDNDRTLSIYADVAVGQAVAGADFVGTSGMMDGQVGAVRTALDEARHTTVGVMAYAVKYASAFYGPFRDAVGCTLTGDRLGYQMDPANSREASVEAALDVSEGADILMVKPAAHYLDVIHHVRSVCDVPVAAYQVSGEAAMVEAAAAQGWIAREEAIDESLTCIKRAGAQPILTYWALEAAQRLNAYPEKHYGRTTT